MLRGADEDTRGSVEKPRHELTARRGPGDPGRGSSVTGRHRRTAATPSPTRSQWAGWPAYAAAVWAFAFAVPHLYWALGGRAGLTFSLALRGPEEQDLIRDPWFVALGLWGVAILCIVAGLIALANVRPWGRSIPRRALLAATWVACAILMARAFFYPGFLFSGLRVLGVMSTRPSADPAWFRWDLVLWSPWFLLGGALFGAAA